MRTRMLPCERCGRLVAVRSKGLCPACRARDMREWRERPRKVRDKALTRDSGLTMFFERHVKILSGVQRSLTGKEIYGPTKANVCHLFPKRHYKSVATEDRNVAYLTLEEHTRLDYLLDVGDLDRIETEFGPAGAIILGRMAALLPYVKEQGKLKRRVEKWKERLKESESY